MKKHLKNIGKIISKFKKKYNFVESYLDIKGSIDVNAHSRLRIICNTEFDNFTITKVKAIESKLYEDIRSYMEKHKITETIHIETQYRGWAAHNQIIFIKEYVTC